MTLLTMPGGSGGWGTVQETYILDEYMILDNVQNLNIKLLIVLQVTTM